MAENKAVKEKNKETLKKNWWEVVKLATKFKEYRLVILKILMESESILDGDLGV